MLYDAFISHATEDKESFVRELAEKLQKLRIEIWYDEFSLKIGDSLRSSIDTGLSKSRYGIVILSKNFFNKRWTNWELNGLVQRQNNSESSLIIPIWHNIERNDILEYSPPLADIIAINSKKGIDYVVNQIQNVINPEGSTLIIARNRLLDFDFQPPVITDDWWLDIIEYSGSNPMEGSFQDSMGWGRWGFPLPEKNETPQQRGERLAWAAMQKSWIENADAQSITQITHPNEVLNFIDSQSGLVETCLDFPEYLAAYAPQLTIPGFGGKFETSFEEIFRLSSEYHTKLREKDKKVGIGLTINRKTPLCDEFIAFRDKNFGYYEASGITCNFVQGELMGPSVKFYDHADYMFWLLSTNSNWLPVKIKKFLLLGMKQWAVWLWNSFESSSSDFKKTNFTGALANALYSTKTTKSFKLTKKIEKDIKNRISHTKKILKLADDIESIFQNFMQENFIGKWIEEHHKKIKS
jgi:hypothetical protein